MKFAYVCQEVKHISIFVRNHDFHMSKSYGGRKRKSKKGSTSCFALGPEATDLIFFLGVLVLMDLIG